jgi:hypothetical protein
MDRELRSVLRYVLSTGDLGDLDEEQTHALIRICQDRIAYLSRGRGYYLTPALDLDRDDMWFVMDGTSRVPAWARVSPLDYNAAIGVAQRLNERLAVREGPLSDAPGMSGVFHRVGCIRTGATLTHYPETGPRCEYCDVGP